MALAGVAFRQTCSYLVKEAEKIESGAISPLPQNKYRPSEIVHHVLKWDDLDFVGRTVLFQTLAFLVDVGLLRTTRHRESEGLIYRIGYSHNGDIWCPIKHVAKELPKISGINAKLPHKKFEFNIWKWLISLHSVGLAFQLENKNIKRQFLENTIPICKRLSAATKGVSSKNRSKLSKCCKKSIESSLNKAILRLNSNFRTNSVQSIEDNRFLKKCALESVFLIRSIKLDKEKNKKEKSINTKTESRMAISNSNSENRKSRMGNSNSRMAISNSNSENRNAISGLRISNRVGGKKKKKKLNELEQRVLHHMRTGQEQIAGVSWTVASYSGLNCSEKNGLRKLCQMAMSLGCEKDKSLGEAIIGGYTFYKHWRQGKFCNAPGTWFCTKEFETFFVHHVKAEATVADWIREQAWEKEGGEVRLRAYKEFKEYFWKVFAKINPCYKAVYRGRWLKHYFNWVVLKAFEHFVWIQAHFEHEVQYQMPYRDYIRGVLRDWSRDNYRYRKDLHTFLTGEDAEQAAYQFIMDNEPDPISTTLAKKYEDFFREH